MTSVWAVLELQTILRNLMQWATRILKPTIAMQLSHCHDMMMYGNPAKYLDEGDVELRPNRRPKPTDLWEWARWRELEGLHGFDAIGNPRDPFKDIDTSVDMPSTTSKDHRSPAGKSINLPHRPAQDRQPMTDTVAERSFWRHMYEDVEG